MQIHKLNLFLFSSVAGNLYGMTQERFFFVFFFPLKKQLGNLLKEIIHTKKMKKKNDEILFLWSKRYQLADLDLHCLPSSMWIYTNNLDQVIWLAEN